MDKVPTQPAAADSDDIYGNMRDGGMAGKVLDKVQNAFEDGLGVAKNCARLAVHSFNQMPGNERPDEVQLQLGIDLGTEAGAVVATVSANAQIQITMSWKPK